MELNNIEQAVFNLIENCNGKITQLEISRHERWLWCLEKYELNVVPRPQETTLRHIRKIIRDLRIKHKLPILSSHEGYWVVKNEEEANEYLTRLEKVAAAQSKSWWETYSVMKDVFKVESTFFENNFKQGNLFE